MHSRWLCGLLLFVALPLSSPAASHGAGFTVNHSTADGFRAIPAQVLAQVRERLRIYYNHTSHGSQLVTGLEMLAGEGVALPPLDDAYSTDLGNADWPAITRSFLAAHAGTNVVMWSWCGQLSWMSASEVNAYLVAMTALEADYPGVTFVYMTGHLDGTGPTGTLHGNNERIRAYCRANAKVLFDFADIERFDPAGDAYPEGSDACEWCEDWCATHDCPDCGGCAHSHCFNCYRKGQALWGLFARLVGYAGPGRVVAVNLLLFM